MEVKKNEKGEIHCIRCNRWLASKHFYLDKNKTPMTKCKPCLTAHVKLDSPSTVYPILQEVDSPFIPSEWSALVDRYRDQKNSHQTITGRYLAKMKLAQFKDLTFDMTDELVEKERLQADKAEQIRLKERERLLAQGIDPDEHLLEPEFDFGSLFTKEEKKILIGKWGKHYQEDELAQLEQFYTDMHASNDIDSAAHEDYLKQICKISLRMHQAIDVGDIEGYNKLGGVYDKLMKSAKFTAAQKKEVEHFTDAIGVMVKMCEEQGFIPVYAVDSPMDQVDTFLRDSNQYVERLVKDELNLGSLIEGALKQLEIQEQMDKAEDELDEEEDLFNLDIVGETSIEDMVEEHIEGGLEDGE